MSEQMAKILCYSYNDFNTEMSRFEWHEKNIPENVCIISIGNPYDDGIYAEPHRFSETCANVLNIDFDDIDPEACGSILDEYKVGECEYVFEHGQRCRVMSQEQADSIEDFIDSNVGNDIYVHCSAGISRSQGVVRYVLDEYPETYNVADTRKENPCKHPNMYVVTMLKRAHRRKRGIHSAFDTK